MASNRLKRKAEADPDIAENTNLLESFVTYGTALPSLASIKKDQGEYVPLWQQEVRDEKGRRRLHGAFTGGFSAGYFNTVGSKEGWTPATFVSSRDAKASGKAKTAAARPEDFMDEEDLAELKSSRTFQADNKYGMGSAPTQSFAPPNGADTNFDSAVANSLRDLIKPGSSKIGQQILQKMGWKPGHGIGPKVTRQQRDEQMLDYGLIARIDLDDHMESGTNGTKAKHLYPPADPPLMTFKAKQDSHGIGYTSGPSLHQPDVQYLRPAKPTGMPSGKEMPVVPRGGAFGISALEDADDDDNDVYGMGPDNHVRVLDVDDDMPNNGARRPMLLNDGGVTRSKKGEPRSTLQPTRPMQQSDKFADGSAVISGFVLASQAQPAEKWFAIDAPPKDFRPNPKAVWERERKKPVDTAAEAEATVSMPLIAVNGKAKTLTPDDRAAKLGEEIRTKSVFEYLNAKNKERLNTFLSTVNIQSAVRSGSTYADVAGQTNTAGIGPSQSIVIPPIEASMAQNALRGFMPYGDDKVKQQRYKAFLTAHAVPADLERYKPGLLPGKTIADVNRELMDFAQAASVFKPMSGAMASRFTSGSTSGTMLDANAPAAGLRMPSLASKFAGPGDAADEEKRKAEAEEARLKADPRRAAVKAGMYGRLTRTEEAWFPVKLLCKRFNVADPHPEGAPGDKADIHRSDVPRDVPIFGQNFNASIDLSEDNAAKPPDADDTMPAASTADLPIPSLENVGLGDDETQGRDTLTYVKPPMDIYRAIFADSDDDDDDEEEEDVGAGRRPGNDSAGPSRTPIAAASAAPAASSMQAASLANATPLTMTNIAEFKPAFVSRGERSTVSSKPNKERKKKAKASHAMSFAMEEDGDDNDIAPVKKSSKDRPRNEKKDRAKAATMPQPVPTVDEDDMWVEKEAMPPQAPSTSINGQALRPGRVKASELF